MRAAIIVVLASAGLLSGVLEAITGLITEYGYPGSLCSSIP